MKMGTKGERQVYGGIWWAQIQNITSERSQCLYFWENFGFHLLFLHSFIRLFIHHLWSSLYVTGSINILIKLNFIALTTNIYYLILPMGQEFKELSGSFWLRIPEEVARRHGLGLQSYDGWCWWTCFWYEMVTWLLVRGIGSWQVGLYIVLLWGKHWLPPEQMITQRQKVKSFSSSNKMLSFPPYRAKQTSKSTLKGKVLHKNMNTRR